MTRPKILVTGSTGKTGSPLVEQLLMEGWPVRALVRVNDARSERLRQLGAEVVVADLFDASGLAVAMQGVKRAYWCPPFHPHTTHAALAFADAARHAKIESIVGLSQWLASPSHPSLATRQVWLADRLFESLAPDIAYTAVTPGFFADNYLRLIGFAAQLGVLPSTTGDSLNAPPSNEDIARVAAKALTDPAAHAGKTYRPTGPKMINTAEMASILSSVLGRHVRRTEMPMWLFLKAARMQRVGAFELSGFRHYVEDHKQGAFALGGPTSHVHDLTGREAEDFATVAKRYARRPEAKRSVGNRIRAIANFMRTPMMPGYDLARYDKSLQSPMPTSPRFSMEDDVWMANHRARALSLPRQRVAVAAQ
jgi:uncharacterized protein YbjT (DUF2867 family)